jgi:HAD superfamily hydrolase (TIGR01549 family)
MLDGVLLDIDGTFVLSNDAHAQAWVEAFTAYGYEILFEQVRPLIGMGGDHILPHFAPELNDQDGTGKEIAAHRKKLILTKFGSHLAPAPGARALVQKLQEQSLQLMVASSATSEELELLLKVAQIDDLVHEATTSDDAEASKPQPDIIEAALSKAQLAPDRVVMLGDAPYDIEAAGKAGVSVIAFRTGGFSDEQLAGAIALYDDPADLLQHYHESPLNQSA